MKRMMVVALAMIVASAATWGLAQRTQAKDNKLSTQDYIDIQQLYAAYCHAIDSSNWPMLASIFVPSGGLNNGTVDSLIESAKGQVARTKGGGRHWMGNLMITPTPEGARGQAYMFVLETASAPPGVRPTGIYDDTLVRTPQGWRFNRRVLRTDNAAPRPQ